MTPTQRINKLGKKWITKFRLQDWDIHFRYAPQDFDPERPHFAVTECLPHIRAAAVSVFDLFDLENTIVHELLHLVLAPYHGNVPEQQEEQTICTLAVAYVGTRHKPTWRGGKCLSARR